MATFQITSAAGMDMGTFEGETAQDAIRAMNREAECSDLDRNDGLIVTQTEPHTKSRNADETARKLLAVLRAGMMAPESVRAHVFEHDDEDYILVTETADGTGDFAYVAFEIETWLENRDADLDTAETYQDFCDSCDPVEDETVARAALDQVGIVPCRRGNCERVIEAE